MVSSPPVPDDRDPAASEPVDLSKPQAEVDPPIWAIGPAAARAAPAGGPTGEAASGAATRTDGPGTGAPAGSPGAGRRPSGAVPRDPPPYDAPPPDWVPIVDETQYRATPRDLGLEFATALVVAVL